MRIILHFKDGKETELNQSVAKVLMKVVNFNDLVNNPSSEKSVISRFINVDELYSFEIIL